MLVMEVEYIPAAWLSIPVIKHSIVVRLVSFHNYETVFKIIRIIIVLSSMFTKEKVMGCIVLGLRPQANSD
ncbi:MAG: hypothetical protein DLM72_18035 [Candidatus Nitrosopolaris wilkensis]|nr:MAG: hypothetical protein DLM72_18035 [Candidatus Nitrosopolaris wilkensis]